MPFVLSFQAEASDVEGDTHRALRRNLILGWLCVCIISRVGFHKHNMNLELWPRGLPAQPPPDALGHAARWRCCARWPQEESPVDHSRASSVNCVHYLTCGRTPHPVWLAQRRAQCLACPLMLQSQGCRPAVAATAVSVTAWSEPFAAKVR